MKKVYTIRSQRVILDRDVAKLFEISLQELQQKVHENLIRFSGDCMFRLTEKECEALILERRIDHVLPFAFTLHGMLMTASVLDSEIAIRFHIHFIRLMHAIQKVTSDLTIFDLLQQLPNE